MNTNNGHAPPRVVALILNWNGRSDTLACLRSLQQQTYPALIPLVVDNGSQDGSVAAIRADFPAVHLIESQLRPDGPLYFVRHSSTLTA